MATVSVPLTTTACSICHEPKPREAFKNGRNQCKACLSAKDKARYRANAAYICAKARARKRNNPEKQRALTRAWRRKNPDKTRAHAKAWQRKNPEKVRANARSRAKAWRLKNLEKARAKDKASRLKNHDKKRADNQKRRAQQRQAAINDFTAAQWQEMLVAYRHHCVYCGRKMQRLTQDHLTPLAKGGNHTKSNIVPACRSCNSKKGKGAPLVPVQPLLL